MISVVVPAYNAAKYLAETVQSLEAQTFADWELIIVDDGSTDETLAVAEKLAHRDSRISVFSQKNAGVSAARNAGSAQADETRPYMLYLDGDDLLVPGALQTLLPLLESRPEVAAACGFMQDIDAEGRVMAGYHRFEPLTRRRGVEGRRLVQRERGAPLVFGDLCFHCHIITPGQVLIRKTALNAAGLFDTARAYGEDYHFWWRLVMLAGPIAVTDEPVVLYRHHESNSSNSPKAVKSRKAISAGRTDFHWNFLGHPGMTAQQRQTVLTGYFYNCLVHWEYAVFYLRRGSIKRGFKQAGLGARNLLRYLDDLVRLRKQASA